MDKLKTNATNKMMWITLVVGSIIIISTTLFVCVVCYARSETSETVAGLEEDIIQQEDLVSTAGMSEEELQELNEEEQKEIEDDEKEEEKKTTTTTTTTKNKYYIKVNYGAQVVTIYTYDESGKYTVPVRACICSTGAATPTSGVYTISWKATWGLLYGNVWGHYCCRVVGDILFHSVPYKQAANNTLVSTYYDRLGSKDSMGCIRLTTADAKWIYENCVSGTQVEFYSSSDPGPLGKPTAIKVSNAPGDLKNWDPTDPDPNNPWIAYLAEQNDDEDTNTESTNNETTENTNTETQNTNTTNNETTNNESTNTSTTNTENAGNTNSETENTQNTNTENTTENTNVENTETENIEGETQNTENTNTEGTNAENNVNNENIQNTTNEETGNTEFTNTQANGT